MSRSLTLTDWVQGDSLNATNLNSRVDTIEAWAALVDADLDSQGEHGQRLQLGQNEEEVTIAAAAYTDSTIQIPAGAVVFGVSARVTTVIPTANNFLVGAATTGEQFSLGATAVAAGTTDRGTRSCPFCNVTAQAIRITPNATPAAATGKVRITIHYYQVTPATS